jgi:hypothetical protein
MVAYASNPIYLGRQNWGGSWFQARLGKMLETPISRNKLDMVVCICNPSYCADVSRRIVD